MKTNHKTRMVHVGSRSMQIDTGIADLVEQLWIAWIDTQESCEETEPGMAYLYFSTIDDLRKMLNILGNTSDVEDMDSLYRRLVPPYDSQKSDKWRFYLNVGDDAICDPGSPSLFTFGVHLVFPISDIEEVTHLLRMYNASNHGIK